MSAIYQPSWIDWSMLETVEAHIETTDLIELNQDNSFTLDRIILELLKKGKDKVSTELDNLWIKGTAKGSGNMVFGNYYGSNLYQSRHLVADTINPADYWNMLERVSDPEDYLRLLAFYKSGGICLNQKPVIPFISYSGDVPWNCALYSRTMGINDWPVWDGTSPDNSNIQLYPPSWDVSNIHWQLISNILNIEPRNVAEIYNRTCLPWGGGGSPASFLMSVGYPDVTMKPDYGKGDTHEHRLKYAQACKRFGEVIKTRYLKETFNLLQYAKLEDLPSIKAAYLTLLNRIALDVAGMINMQVRIEVQNKDRNYAVERVYYCNIPGDFITGPRIYYDSEMRYPEFTALDSEGKTVVIIPAITFRAGNHTARQALTREYLDALYILLMNMNKIEARLIQTADTSVQLVSTKFTLDPYENPFLVYDPQSVDIPVFQNVARSLAQMDPQGNTVLIDPAIWGIPEVKHFEQAEYIRGKLIRNIPLEFGGYVSAEEAELTGKKSLVPYIVLGAAAALVASQAL